MRITSAVCSSLLLLAIFSGCGGSTTGASAKKKVGTGQGQGQPEQQGCPATPPASYHRIIIQFQKPLPAKLGLKMDIDSDMRVSECANRSQQGPFASLSRVQGSNDLIVNIEHRGFYNPLPRDISFQIFDLQNCGPTSQAYFALTSQPLVWKFQYPNGETCAGQYYATLQVLASNDELPLEE